MEYGSSRAKTCSPGKLEWLVPLSPWCPCLLGGITLKLKILAQIFSRIDLQFPIEVTPVIMHPLGMIFPSVSLPPPSTPLHCFPGPSPGPASHSCSLISPEGSERCGVRENCCRNAVSPMPSQWHRCRGIFGLVDQNSGKEA